MLEGLLVDLVPYGTRFMDKDYEWSNNESRFWGSMGDRPLPSKSQIEARHREWAESDPTDLDMGFGIQTKDGQPIGFIGLKWVVPHSRLAMLGAVIGEPDYWNGGYGTDALLLIADYAFDWLDLRRLWLETMALNARVIRQMEKVGFTLEARRREATFVDGQWVDTLFYGLLRDEWPGRDALIQKLGLKAK